MNAPYHNKALPQGTVLREWRLEEVLGSGGFGIVYRGTGIYFGEDVAIKEYFPGGISDRMDGTTVAPTDSSSEDVYELGRKKFMEEAKVLWNLSRPERHPNIVNVRSLFETHGTAYMVMDFESGTSLSDMLHKGHKFDEQSLLGIIRPIARGLERAHRGGVLHRDIKPANILVDQSGRPVLIDFGSARFESGQATNTRVTFYTPPYAAIEQYVKTFPQGPWTDIYALGVVLYQCVSGEKPPEVLERLHGGVGQSLSAKDWPGFSRTFTRAVDAAMAIRPLDRPQFISEWLKLFEDNRLTPADEATRIGVMAADATPPFVSASQTQLFAEAGISSKQDVTAPAAPPAQPKLKHGLVGALAAVILVSLIFFLLWPRSSRMDQVAAVSAGVTQTQGGAHKDLDTGLANLIETARKLNRPQVEISALTDARVRILDFSAKGNAEGADQAAREAGKSELTALSRSARRVWANLSALPVATASADTTGNINKLKAAKAELDTKLAVDLTVSNAAATVGVTQQALEAWSVFQLAHGTAYPLIWSARQKDLSDLAAKAVSSAEQVETLAKVPKPWFLASEERKKAYQLRQDNAAQARALLTTLQSAVSVAQSSKDLKLTNDAIAQLTEGEATLAGLVSSSSAANP